MRDPDRIKPALERLAQVWSVNPNLRLGQLIGNVFVDPYYVEDEVFIEKIEAFYYKTINGENQ